MLLLLDGHFSQHVSRPLRARGIDVWTLDEWHDRRYRDQVDRLILAAAFAEARTLVTYDCKTVPGLLGELAENGLSHGGVILVDDRTIRQNDIGGLIRALVAFVEQYGDESWVDRVSYLPPA
jgi:hypothetical protein